MIIMTKNIIKTKNVKSYGNQHYNNNNNNNDNKKHTRATMRVTTKIIT